MMIQIFVVLLAVLSLIKAWRAYFAGALDKRKVLGWSVLWLIGVTVVWLPETTNWLADISGVGRGVDVVVYSSVLVLFFVLFQTSRKVDKLDRQLTELVRLIALKNVDHNDKQTR